MKNFVSFQYRTAYRTLMKKIVSLLGANQTGFDMMDRVFEFEKKLANVSIALNRPNIALN